jgi:DNA gyrase/topoisomerase IV subunit A
MITNDGTMIRTPADGVPMYGRSASGVIVMRLSEGSSLVNFALTEKESEEEVDLAEISESDEEDGDNGVTTVKMEETVVESNESEQES